jgi:hypothetical protein
VIHRVADTLLRPGPATGGASSGGSSQSASQGFDPCVLSESAVVKLLCGAGLRPTAANAVRRALMGGHGVVSAARSAMLLCL